jgi:hypothetical protein
MGNPRKSTEALAKVVGLEREIKSQKLSQGLCVGRVLNTIQEQERCREASTLRTGNVLIVTDEAHSRGARWVARKIWGKGFNIFIDPVSISKVISPENPMKALRDPRDWIAVNIFRQMILWTPFGFTFLKKTGAYQPSSKV